MEFCRGSAEPEAPSKHVIRRRKRTKAGKYVDEVTEADLAAKFSMTAQQAAKATGVSFTIFKKICRKFGLERWPYRRLKALGLAGEAPTGPLVHVPAAAAAAATAAVAATVPPYSPRRLQQEPWPASRLDLCSVVPPGVSTTTASGHSSSSTVTAGLAPAPARLSQQQQQHHKQPERQQQQHLQPQEPQLSLPPLPPLQPERLRIGALLRATTLAALAGEEAVLRFGLRALVAEVDSRVRDCPEDLQQNADLALLKAPAVDRMSQGQLQAAQRAGGGTAPADATHPALCSMQPTAAPASAAAPHTPPHPEHLHPLPHFLPSTPAEGHAPAPPPGPQADALPQLAALLQTAACQLQRVAAEVTAAAAAAPDTAAPPAVPPAAPQHMTPAPAESRASAFCRYHPLPSPPAAGICAPPPLLHTADRAVVHRLPPPACAAPVTQKCPLPFRPRPVAVLPGLAELAAAQHHEGQPPPDRLLGFRLQTMHLRAAACRQRGQWEA